MLTKTNIQWTDYTWNIARGCDKVDSDCKFCYMYRESLNETRYVPNEVVRTKSVFKKPLQIKEPSKIFTSSLTDFFHPAIDAYRSEAWDIIRQCPHHTFQILTKRPERIRECLPADWGDGWRHVWLGTSIGSNSDTAQKRAEDLAGLRTSMSFDQVLFISAEPMHGPVEWPTDFDGSTFFDWLIIGGESGNETGKYRYRPCNLEWISTFLNAAKKSGAKVFVKQLGTFLAKEMKLEDRHGGNPDEWPDFLRIQEFPKQ